jgi:hypothetical protein
VDASPSGGPAFLGLNAIAPPTAALTVGPGPADAGGPTAAVLVPVILGLMALLLAATVLVRRRRLAGAANNARDARLSAFSRVAGSGTDLQRGLKRRKGPGGPRDN